ncbi:CoxG family protein [Noviherbaspirillum denitrificans]|uniref:Carbon monoxide dehydrogenase n=1 Tax=Noviherbaspirillum denitrificans TaxID=1968433 RepID=A0A254TCS5_9BURK|nr:carbon monoxide dehydrogenase subunit G [Noviherbaspirillum denitrificans]OWW20449.1 hypothetical protein AYR66_14090 [Noviherbaspirillum denitrificans]
MELTGSQIIAAPRQSVWEALNNPDILQRCLPGCEKVERLSPEEFQVLLVAAIGPLRARFKGLLKLSEARAPESCVMLFEGQGGPVGFGKGSSEVVLNETDDGTELNYKAKAQVGGKLAQVGSRLIDNVAKKMSDDFFEAFRNQLSAGRATEAFAVPAVSMREEPRAATTEIPESRTAEPVEARGAQPRPSKENVRRPDERVAGLPGFVPVPTWSFAALLVTFGIVTGVAGTLLLR